MSHIQFMLNQWGWVRSTCCVCQHGLNCITRCNAQSCLTSEVEFVPRVACANIVWIASHDAMHIYILVASHIQQSCNSHDCTRWCVHAHHHMCCVDIWIMPHTQFMLNQWVELVPRVACAKMFWIAPAASTLWQCHTFNSCLTSEVEFVPRFACANMRWIAPHDAMHIYILVASTFNSRASHTTAHGGVYMHITTCVM